MGPRLQKGVTEGLQGYDTVTHSLDKYTRKMKERAQGLLAKPEEPRSLDDFYGVSMSHQQLHIRFFEQQSEALNRLGQWWQTAVETTRKQLGDTERRP